MRFGECLCLLDICSANCAFLSFMYILKYATLRSYLYPFNYSTLLKDWLIILKTFTPVMFRQKCQDSLPLCHNILLLLLPFNFIFYIVTTETYILLTTPTNFSSDRRFSKEVCCNASSNVNWTLKRLLLSRRLDN